MREEQDPFRALLSMMDMALSGQTRDGEESDVKPSDFGFLEEGFYKAYYRLGGDRLVWQFPNKLGASLIRGGGTYGSESGLWEMGFIEEDEDGGWGLIDDSGTGYSQVKGYLNVDDVNELLIKIKNVPDRDRDVLKWINEDIVDSETILKITE